MEELSIITFKNVLKYYLDEKILESQYESLNNIELYTLSYMRPFCDKIIKNHIKEFNNMYESLKLSKDINNINALTKLLKSNKQIPAKIAAIAFTAVLVNKLTKYHSITDAQSLSYCVSCDMSLDSEKILNFINCKNSSKFKKSIFKTISILCIGTGIIYYYLTITK
ncbi:anti-apoptotic factor [Eptesipox virus]|uniref:Anti-apoptotic factor n=1 Tax=Eptesipox virus TaxID=1329402 RepID=A0A220T681_9POXV|nr:anti-apoptotic factor [Eptesipox virus]ASK51217.1 anti-apoptotic factor [Eptesipox virus]WAH70975.1 anti-apoptotic factor [Eptesipox virus]